MKNIVMAAEKKVILPSEIRTPEGFVYPSRRVGKRILPSVPVGMGVFSKWSLQVLDEDKKIVPITHPQTGKRIRKLECPTHSFTRNFGYFVRGHLSVVDANPTLNETMTDDTGSTFLIRVKCNGTSSWTGTIAPVTGLCKIKFGNSSAALDTTQFNLQGGLLGPSTEGTCTVTLTTEDATNTIFVVQGQVTNGSGGAFSVEEMGIFAELGSTTGTTNNTTMMMRDLTGTVNVNNGQTIIGTYTFTIAV